MEANMHMSGSNGVDGVGAADMSRPAVVVAQQSPGFDVLLGNWGSSTIKVCILQV